MAEINQWSCPGNSNVSTTQEDIPNVRNFCYVIPEDIVKVENPFNRQKSTTFNSNDLADFEVLLNNLLNEITTLEAQREELTKRALSTDFAKAAEVVISHRISMTMRLQDTLEELNDVISGTYANRREVSDLNRFVKAQTDSLYNSCDSASSIRGMIANKKESCSVTTLKEKHVIEKLDNLESIVMKIIPENYDNKKNEPNLDATTIVANGSNHVIWIKVESDRDRVRQSTASTESFTGKDITSSFSEKLFSGYTMLLQGQFLPFRPPTNPVYISIVAQECGEIWRKDHGSCFQICDAYTVKLDDNVSVGKDNQVHLSQPGSIWVDTNGYNHYRPSH